MPTTIRERHDLPTAVGLSYEFKVLHIAVYDGKADAVITFVCT